MSECASIAERISRAHAGGRARLVRARNVAHALGALGLLGSDDVLFAWAGDVPGSLPAILAPGRVVLVDDLECDSFSRATRIARDEMGERPGDVHWFVNSIGGPGLRVPDLKALSRAAHETGATLIVDDTVASSYGCRPLEQGADLCLEALDRVAAGGLTEPCVALVQARPSRRRISRSSEGLCAGRLFSASCEEPTQDDLVTLDRALGSFEERMQLHMDHARAIAEYLAAHPRVPSVAYPGLRTHPDRELVSRVLLHGAGPAVDFEVPGGDAAGFIARLGSGFRAPSPGGAATRASARDGATGRWIRLFVGTDDPLACIESLERALASTPRD
ncbi:MAG: PLP-dependent transferase [Collinsella sp.]|nr:PLP-dependent transferase [Collinsella sp.]